MYICYWNRWDFTTAVGDRVLADGCTADWESIGRWLCCVQVVESWTKAVLLVEEFDDCYAAGYSTIL